MLEIFELPTKSKRLTLDNLKTESEMYNRFFFIFSDFLAKTSPKN